MWGASANFSPLLRLVDNKINPKCISTLITFERIAALVIVKVRNANSNNELIAVCQI
jgi:hypothetical protein